MRRLREFIAVNVLLAVFIIILVNLHPVNDIRKYDIYDQFEFTHRAIIYGSRSVSQEFTCNIDCDSIEIQAATIKLCDGSYKVALKDETGSVLSSWTAEEIDLTGEQVSFRCDGPVMKAGNRYVLEVSAPDCDISRALVLALEEGYRSPAIGIFKCSNYDETEETYFADKAMSIAVYRSHRNIFAYISCLIIIIAINLCLLWKDKGIEWLAPVVLVSSCLVMLLALSPGSGLDDEYHYYSAFKLSNIMMGRENAGEVETMYAYDLIPDVNANYNFMNVLENIRYRKPGDGNMFIMDGHSDRLRWPVSHFGPAVGITIGRLLKMNFIQIYTLGRITSMCMYILMVLAAIRLTPVNKELMLLLSATPMVAQQATQITYDTVINGMSFLLVGYILNMMFDKKQISWKDVIATVIIAGLLGPIKVIYAALIILAIAIPRDNFLSVRDYIKKIVFLIVSVFGITLYKKFAAGKGMLTNTDVRVGRPGYTINFVLHDPLRFFKIVARSLEDDFLFYIKQAIGIQLGGRDVIIPELIIIGFAIVIIVCALCEKEEQIFTYWQRLIFAGVSIIGIGMLFALFVFVATPYGGVKTEGLQGRYFISFLIPIMYAMQSKKIIIRLDRINLLIPFWFLQMGCLAHIMNQIDYKV